MSAPLPMTDPRAAQLRFEAGLARHCEGDLGGAELAYREALRHQPGHVQALHHLGIIALQRGLHTQAVELLGQAHRAAPRDPHVLANLGQAFKAGGRLDEALGSFEQALQLDPGAAALWVATGDTLFTLGQPARALEAFQRALRLAPGDAVALNGAAVALLELDRAADALPLVTQARESQPGHAVYALNRALVYARLGEPGHALAECRAARALGLVTAQLCLVQGTAHLDRGEHEAAVAAFDEAIALEPSLAAAYNNRGSALTALARHAEAAQSFLDCLEQLRHVGDVTLSLQCRMNLCSVLKTLGREREVRPILESVYQEAPAFDYAASLLLERRLAAFDWHEHEKLAAEVQLASDSGRSLVAPLALLAASDDAAAQLNCARRHLDALRLPPPLPAPPGSRSAGRLRVGYLSSDFRNHAVSFLVAGVLERHDRRAIELYALSTGRDDGSDIRRRIEAGVEHFVDCAGWPPAAIAGRIRAAGIEVLVDLNGQTSGDHNYVLASRPAPVQVSWLGFPGTSGAAFIDYLVADDFLVPAGSEGHYSEQIVYLSPGFQANDDRRPRPPACARQETGLPEDAFVFCSFNASYKLNPAMFDAWCRLLCAAPSSVLWVLAPDAAAADNLRGEARRRGVDGARLVFASMLPYREHLARLAHADLFLDSLPFNGGTTASDALWMGVPVLTCAGRAYAARMAGSLLNTLGVPELVTGDLEAYERRALELARQPERLGALRARLSDPRVRSRLFDTERYCRALEQAYRQMWARHAAGNPPAPLRVPG